MRAAGRALMTFDIKDLLGSRRIDIESLPRMVDFIKIVEYIDNGTNLVINQLTVTDLSDDFISTEAHLPTFVATKSYIDNV